MGSLFLLEKQISHLDLKVCPEELVSFSSEGNICFVRLWVWFCCRCYPRYPYAQYTYAANKR